MFNTHFHLLWLGQASPVLLINCFLLFTLFILCNFLKDVLTLLRLFQKVNLRSEGYATQRLIRIRIVSPNYPSRETDLY